MDYMYDDYEGDVVDRAADFLADLLSYMGYDAEIHTEVIDNTAVFDVIGEDVKSISPAIDPTVVNALSWILRRARFTLGSGYRFDVDVNSYRLERIHKLEGVAEELHNKINDGLNQITCFGMDNVDRRALHLLLNADPSVKTESNGYGAFRHLEVSKAE
ncbi:MAG: hypothetical protein IJU23_12305 [Proteobacteria bacterium]|nr:hypothetical protein [Pseudomonadota bacterium]